MSMHEQLMNHISEKVGLVNSPTTQDVFWPIRACSMARLYRNEYHPFVAIGIVTHPVHL